MPTTLERLRATDKRLLAESARATKALDAVFSQDVLQEALALAVSTPSAPHIRRRGRPVVQLRPSAKNVAAWSIGQKVRAARERKGWRQEDLARETGIARPNIARLEKGRQIPKVATLRRLAWALRLELAELLMSPEQDARGEVGQFAEAGVGDWSSQLERLD